MPAPALIAIVLDASPDACQRTVLAAGSVRIWILEPDTKLIVSPGVTAEIVVCPGEENEEKPGWLLSPPPPVEAMRDMRTLRGEAAETS